MDKQVEIGKLRQLSPISSLKKDNLEALVKKTELKFAKPGETLFNEGESAKRAVWVLSGNVDLRRNNETVSTIAGGTNAAIHPLSPHLPRQHAAVAVSNCEYITIDSDLLDVMLTWDQTGQYEVSDLRSDVESEDDWMTTLLQTKAFHKIPPANIQAIFMRLQQVNH
jgi:CRP-like cAMP-binding protein